MNPRRHQQDTKTFAELTFEEQVKAMNMNALQFRKQLTAHLRRADEEGRSRLEVLNTRLNLLRNILDEYAEQVKEPTLSVQFKRLTPFTTPAASEVGADQTVDTFMCSECHVRRSRKEANMSADGMSFICDSCYLANP